MAYADDQVRYAEGSAYGTRFPDVTKRFRTAGWYFSGDAAFDILTADTLKPGKAYRSSIDKDNPFPFYERWGDSFNVATEFVAVNQARALAALAGLMARTPLKDQPWRAATAKIVGVASRVAPGTAVTARLEVTGLNTNEARIVWEASGQQPVFRRTFTITPGSGSQWIEAEAQWPDGRRAFGRGDFTVAAER